MESKLKRSSLNIAIVGHKYTITPEDFLALYLKDNNRGDVIQLKHSFSFTKDRISSYVWYRNGVVYKENRSRDYYKYPELFIYIKEFLFTLNTIRKTKQRWSMYIAIDGLCTSFGLILKLLGKVDKVCYWAMDFVPNRRFSSTLKNCIYRKVNTISYLNADEVWDLSPRMRNARKQYLGISENKYKKIKIVPYGVWIDRITKYRYYQCEKNTIVFMGFLLEKQGVQQVISAIPEIAKSIPNFIFKIIGDGPYKKELEDLAQKLCVKDNCMFMGKIEDNVIMENEIAKSCLAIAPYLKELDTWTYYADPGKLKEYLACGVPVLLTDVSWNTKEIVENGCGLIITSNPLDIAKRIIEMMSSDKIQAYRENSIKYAERFNYSRIFNNLIK